MSELKNPVVLELISPQEIMLDVYYCNEHDFKEHKPPLEVIMTFPKDFGIEPIKFSGSFVNCYDVRDTTEDYSLNKDIKENENKFRTASIDLFGAVNYHVINE